MPGVCPAWKATGNSTPAQARPPRPVPSPGAAVPPPHSACFLFQRSEVWAPMLTPRCCSDPGLSQATGRGQAAPHGTQCCATAPCQLHCSPHPRHFSLAACPMAHEEAERLAQPEDSVVHQEGTQVRRECQPPNCQPAQQKSCFWPNSWAPSTLWLGPVPQPIDHCHGLTTGLLFLVPEQPGPT